MARALTETMELVAAITDAPGAAPRDRSAMNFLVTDGEVMVATRRNRTLFLSDGRRSASCKTSEPIRHGTQLDQLVIASEALCGNHTAWNEVSEEEVIGVDGRLVLHRWRLADFAVVAEPPRPLREPRAEQR